MITNNTPPEIRIILADDHPIVREGVALQLKKYPHMHLVNEFDNGKQVIDFLKTGGADIVIMDIEMPIMNGLEALSIITRRFPEVKVIMLTMHTDNAFIYDAITRGAKGYLTKDCNMETLSGTIDKVHAHGRYFDPKIIQILIDYNMNNDSRPSRFNESALSPKEIDILLDLCNEKTMKEIADCHHISIDTVRFHLKNLYAKTKSKKTAGLVKYAIKNHIISLH